MINKRKFSACISVSIVTVLVLFSAFIHAEPSEQAIEQLQQQVATLAEKLVVTQQTVSEIEESISVLEGQQAETKQTIATQEEKLVLRKEHARKRLVQMQLDDKVPSMLNVLLSSESISDFFDRLSVITRLQEAANERIRSVEETLTNLSRLKAEQSEQAEKLVMQAQNLKIEKQQLEQQSIALHRLIDSNRDRLNQLAVEKLAEQERLFNLYKAQQTATSQTTESSSTLATTTTDKVTPENNVETQVTTVATTTAATTGTTTIEGKQIEVEATAYSYQEPGLTPFTFTGIDLRLNPQVIAVDPKVIPLNSYVLIPGMGVYLAGDTGGAIKGNRIDIHMLGLDNVTAFGRKKITVTIIKP